MDQFRNFQIDIPTTLEQALTFDNFGSGWNRKCQNT